MILRYAAAWLLLMIAAVANGAVRELVYRPAAGELAAHQISTLTAILLFGATETARLTPRFRACRAES